MRYLHLGPKLKFPVGEFATAVVAMLGMRGRGKSNLAAVSAEGMLDAGVQVIVLDYVGIWFSLRLDPSGKKPSQFQIPVLGGLHGDIDLAPSAGRVVAEALAASGSPAVLDVSRMSITQRCSFAADFGQALFQAKKDHKGPCHLILEEAQRFIPQMNKLWAGQERMLGAFTEIAEVGRNFGLGMTIVSHRPQKIDTDTLNLAEIGFFFGMNGVHERKRVAEWVQEKGAGDRKEVFGELPGIPRGTAKVWATGETKLYGDYDFFLKSTYDAGATPTKAQAPVKMRALDLGALEVSMAGIVEQAKATDPKLLAVERARLQAQVLKLERQLAAGGAAAKTVEVERQVVPEQTSQAMSNAYDISHEIARICGDLTALTNKMSTKLQAGLAAVAEVHGKRLSHLRAPALPQLPARRARAAPAELRVGEDRPGAGVLRILAAVATSMADGLTWRQIASIVGIKPGGTTFSSYKSRAKTGGYVEDRGDRVFLTDLGQKWAPQGEVPADGPALVEFWKRERLNDQQARMLDAALAKGLGGQISRDDLAAATEPQIPASGTTFSSYLSRMRTFGVLVEQGRHEFTAAEMFFR